MIFPSELSRERVKVSHVIVECRVINHHPKFIEHNELLCNSQHGFVSSKSFLTQLLSNFDDIYEGLLAGADSKTMLRILIRWIISCFSKNSVTMDLTKGSSPGLNPS